MVIPVQVCSPFVLKLGAGGQGHRPFLGLLVHLPGLPRASEQVTDVAQFPTDVQKSDSAKRPTVRPSEWEVPYLQPVCNRFFILSFS